HERRRATRLHGGAGREREEGAMNERREPLSRYVEHEVAPSEIDRQWAAVRARSGKRRVRWSWKAYAVVSAIAVVVALYVGRKSAGDRAHTAWEGATFTSSNAGQVIATPDGSRVRLGDGAALVVTTARDDKIVVTVERGEVTFDVEHVEGRAWI